MSEPLTKDDVAKVAVLARLKLSDAELELLTSQLRQILDYAELLNEVDTDDVEPMAHAVELRNVFRDDLPGTSLSRQQALANAPKTDGQYFLVPQILDAL